MQITFNPQKNSINIVKHGVSLGDAAKLEWDSALIWQDLRYNYNEIRMIGLAPLGTRLYHVVYTDRDEVRRIISLRKANNREKKYYVYHY
jgi:uncharacterized DUF497 family protein